MKFPLFILIIISSMTFAQDPIVYHLNWVEEEDSEKVTRFVSISDQYPLNQHEDSLAIPASYLGQRTSPTETNIKLRGAYRQRCLKALNIAENDVVYIYDYANDNLLRFYVRGLNLIAVQSPYSYGGNYPVSQDDYMIGFEINPKYLGGFKDYHSHVLVSIGKNNPFTQGKVNPIVWTKVDSTLFPSQTELLEGNTRLGLGKPADTYQFKMNDMTFFVQNIRSNGNLNGRHVVVIQSQTKRILFEQIYIGSEGGSPSPLNNVDPEYDNYVNQFAGQLFKNQPPVIFGFMYHSFGCSSIEFISEDQKKIYINCDNRH